MEEPDLWTVTNQRGSFEVHGMLLCMLRQDGTVLVIDAQHIPAATIQDDSAGGRLIDLLNGNINLFNGTTQVNGGSSGPQEEAPDAQ